ncbi:metallophosphoesterase [Lederbergia galactosidilytica]|uniref:Phosphoesterase n=1 Tax=Lederbergia galactosidilytica TaxID=217031 RepID=A0A0Q9Y942_9BACI|nr:metallophosphoesterase [Lederbergia galactosidilytica]KRG12807.1 metallophosphatase [Lederbergia galactosidilytica]KRG13373.1 metallophosphatase [Virgibacillus soli]MBP1914952.1 putative phosphoesterase [Lederbergia galactosidilytica]OAK74236.1 metallophosphatase [Lederbergia galactosidilytica]
MKLLIVSDSHGDRSLIKTLKNSYENDVDALIHCGDSELRAVDPVLKGFHIVKGNCDLDQQFPDELLLDVQGYKIYVTHGHLFQIKSSLQNIAYRAEEFGADFVFFGHSHILGVEKIAGTLFLNPGSILLPRGGNEQTYAIIEQKEDICTVRFFNDQQEEVKSLRREFQRISKEK